MSIRQLEERGDRAQGRYDSLQRNIAFACCALPIRASTGRYRARQRERARRANDSVLEELVFRGTQVVEWSNNIAAARPWPQDRRRRVADVYEEERPKLLQIPHETFVTDERAEVEVGKTPYVRFDLNDYSVPHAYVRCSLVVLANQDTVRVISGTEVIAEHTRSWDRGKQIETQAHIDALVETKRRAARHRSTDRLAQACTSSVAFLEHAAARGANLGRLTQQLIDLLNAHGPLDLEEALIEVLERDRIHLGAVRHVLDRNRAARGLPPPIALHIDAERHAHVVVKPHDLGTYDRMNQEHDDDE
jgi:hypothetical protein